MKMSLIITILGVALLFNACEAQTVSMLSENVTSSSTFTPTAENNLTSVYGPECLGPAVNEIGNGQQASMPQSESMEDCISKVQSKHPLANGVMWGETDGNVSKKCVALLNTDQRVDSADEWVTCNLRVDYEELAGPNCVNRFNNAFWNGTEQYMGKTDTNDECLELIKANSSEARGATWGYKKQCWMFETVYDDHLIPSERTWISCDLQNKEIQIDGLNSTNSTAAEAEANNEVEGYLYDVFEGIIDQCASSKTPKGAQRICTKMFDGGLKQNVGKGECFSTENDPDVEEFWAEIYFSGNYTVSGMSILPKQGGDKYNGTKIEVCYEVDSIQSCSLCADFNGEPKKGKDFNDISCGEAQTGNYIRMTNRNDGIAICEAKIIIQ